MKTSIFALLVLIIGGGARLSEAAAYKVGDSAGWTILGNPNYTAWAISKNFKVGDTLVFEYSKKFHNVLEVSKADYKACNAASPMVAYTSGNDSITLPRRGHYFFICGVPGHCGAGQKVDIRITKWSSSSPAASPLATTTTGANSGAATNPAAAPRPNGAATAVAPTAILVFAQAAALLYFVAYSGGLTA
ncbi:mavicyanin-like [Canna indica]|uniref:Mavicyanin-like n=1 Tax=Canna indica TaxID=4628 RepID=A0AAQ3QFC7_9LILI|nr:mavicyanin-like [Canna indica]